MQKTNMVEFLAVSLVLASLLIGRIPADYFPAVVVMQAGALTLVMQKMRRRRDHHQ